MRKRIRTSVVESLRFALVLLLCLLISGGADVILQSPIIALAASPSSVTLTASTTPSAAEPGVTFVSVTGNGFPSGTIGPSNVTVTLTPATSGPAMTAVVQSVTTIVGPTRKVTFQVSSANEVATPTNYLVSLSGSTTAGAAFASTNTATLTINPPASIVSLSPASGKAGQTSAVTITGLFSNFFQGATTANFGPGISVGGAAAGTAGPVTVNSATSATAQISISSSANPASQSVTVQTGAEIATLNNGFTVTSATSATTTAASNATATFSESSQSVTLNATVTSGAGTVNAGTVTFVVSQGGTQIGTSVTSGTVTSGAASASFAIPASTGAGSYTITATYNAAGGFAGSSDNTHTLTINQASTTTTAANASASFSTSNQNVTLSATVTSPAGAVNVGTVTFTVLQGATQIGTVVTSGTVASGAASASFTLPGGTAAGSYTIKAAYSGTSNLLTSTDTTHTLTVGSSATTTTASNATATFSESSQSVTLNVTVTSGAGTVSAGTVTFAVFQGATQIGSSVTSGTVASGAASASFTIPANTAAGTYTIQASYSGGGGFAASSDNTHTLTISQASTTTTAANASASFSASAQSVTLNATVTSPAGAVNVGTVTFTVSQGATTIGTPATSGTVASGAASATFTIPASTPAGTYTITATFADPGNFLSSSDNSHTLTITGAVTPAIVSITPNTEQTGQTVTVTITGQNTHWVNGTTKANFGPGVAVGTAAAGSSGLVTVTSATTATAQISAAAAAALGSRTVTTQTSAEQETLANGFTVTGPPSIASINPSQASPGASLTVTITGSFTHFTAGVSSANFGAGISVNGAPAGTFGTITNVTSLTTATVNISISASAAPGLRSPITVQTGAETATLANGGFLVLGPAPASPPSPTITNPAEGAEVTTLTTVTGTVGTTDLASWALSYEASGSTVFTNFATGTTSTVTGTFDPSMLLNGIATIQLTVTDQSGQIGTTVVHVSVTRNAKVGNFTLSFTDLTVPVTGIPIQIIRTYDTRNKSVGDFGFGWSLAIKTTQVSISDVLGNNWQVVQGTGELGLPTTCVYPNQNYVVSVTLQGGTVYQFAPSVTAATQCQLLGGSGTVDLQFTPIGATPANATLVQGGPNCQATESCGSDDLLVMSPSPGPTQLQDQNTFDVYGLDGDTDGWTLTLGSGQQLQISVTNGIQKINDTNGNSLTFGPGGITSSTGKGVVFARDAQNRITTITDPNGNVLTYAYDAPGDLTTFTDQLKNVSTFTYDNNHFLLSYTDPRGLQPTRSVYDASGRLIQVIDPFGNVTNFTNDTAASTETVTDALGNPTTYIYDGDGNVTKITDALGNIYSFTYDANDNELSKTDPLGRTTTYTYDSNNNRLTQTDPLGHTTTFAYNSTNQVTSQTDANGLTTTQTYDGSGNVLTSKDPAGNTYSNTFNANGLRSSATDPLGKITTYAYDASGDMTSQTDPAGNTASFGFDSNGNPLTQSLTRTTISGPQTLTTQYEYDAENNETQTTFADGSTNQTVYNQEGQKIATIDGLGHTTSYTYDAGGRLTQVSYADGTSETNTFDADSRRTQHVTRTGATWLYSYDAVGHLISTTDPLGGVTTSTYDAAGQVTSTTDPLGNITKNSYDAAGNLVTTTDALAHVTTYTYDPGNRRTSMTDGNGHTTTYQYDAAGRLVKTIYADGTSSTVAYDARSNVISRTDANGNTTQYTYTIVGQLASVEDALLHTTTYSYDEVGNRISQTDANGHTTAFQYDQLGRRTGRTLPGGQTETLAYDAGGNVVSHVDFNGKTTTYTYDSLNRLLSKVPDPSFHVPTVTYTYTPDGQRASMTDVNGTTNYTYDLDDRLTQAVKPNGTISYSYDAASNMTALTTGTTVTYTYDADNRLDSISEPNTGLTTQSYDAIGNMASMTYPNSVTHSYTYNVNNQLTNLGVTKGAISLASYAYTLDAVGHRLTVAELSGRAVKYAYDNIYRVTSETVSGATAGPNGAVTYTYDPVANRTQTTSTLAGVTSGTFTYDTDDRLTTDTYDANGNTTLSGGVSNVYDFENRLIQHGSATITYDGDGNRVSKTVGGVTTKYLVSDLTPTGFPQVVEETISNGSSRNFVYGLTRISQRQFIASSSTTVTSYYVYDGHGSVRALTDPTGAITDTYDYDAFGNLIHSTGSTPNEFLFAGEQFDSDLGLYYNRARYLNTSTGRFITRDTFQGDPESPLSLHAYLYASANPVNRIDPSGNQDIGDVMVSLAISATLDAISYTSIGGSAIDFVGRLFANGLVPPWVWTALNAAHPDAGVVGVSGSFNVPVWKLPLGLGLTGGAEVLFSRNGAALYAFFGGVATIFQQAKGAGIQGYVGAVWNCAHSEDYTKYFLSLTIPFSILGAALQRKVLNEIVTYALAGTIAAFQYPAIQTMVGYAAQFAGNIATTGSFNLFWTPWVPFASGSTGVSISASLASWGGTAQKYIGIGGTYYWQLLPSQNVTF